MRRLATLALAAGLVLPGLPAGAQFGCEPDPPPLSCEVVFAEPHLTVGNTATGEYQLMDQHTELHAWLAACKDRIVPYKTNNYPTPPKAKVINVYVKWPPSNLALRKGSYTLNGRDLPYWRLAYLRAIIVAPLRW